MWAIVPAGGRGVRIQPLACSKELLPLGRCRDGGRDRPCAVSEYLLHRMFLAGARRICIVIAPDKSDIVKYFGNHPASSSICYATQPRAAGLCDAIFRALPFISGDGDVLIGLPDTIWFPENALARLEAGRFSLLLFPVDQPERFDSVVTDENRRVIEICVKRPGFERWVWGAMRMPLPILRDLHHLWFLRNRSDEYLGTLINAYLAQGGQVLGIRAGNRYIDAGTLEGYYEGLAAVGNSDQDLSLKALSLFQSDTAEVLS